MRNLIGLSYGETNSHLVKVMARAAEVERLRAEDEQARRERRLDELVARGLARAARGRFYDMIQAGRAG